MGTGRATTIQPKSLKKIYSFPAEEINKIRSIAKETNRTGDYRNEFGKIGDLSSHEMLSIHSKPDYKNVKKCLGNRCHKFSQSFESSYSQEFDILGNEDDDDRIAFKNGSIVPHVDGILQDIETGEFIFFIAIGDSNSETGVDVSKLEEGCIVEYTDWYAGVCEVILHKRSPNGEIVGDINLSRDESVITRYVEITGIKGTVDSASDNKKIVRENTRVGLYNVNIHKR